MRTEWTHVWAVTLAIGMGGCALAQAAGDSDAPLKIEVRLAEDKGVFTGDEPLSATLHLSSAEGTNVQAELVTEIALDVGGGSAELRMPVEIPAGGRVDQKVSRRVTAPGFYRVQARLVAFGCASRAVGFTLGYEPEKMAVLASAKPDFRAFWDDGLAALAKVEPRYSLVLVSNLCTESVSLYEVRMRSFGDVVVGGHLAVPKRPGRYPAVVRFLGYGSGPSLPARDNPNVVRYVASTRGQGVMKAENVYGDWMAHRLDSRDDYYYRGAFLDTVRAVDFVCSREEVDPRHIAVEGGSQGGTLSYVCAALDRRVSFCMPCNPGFGDIPNFIGLTRWPGSVYRAYVATNRTGVTQESLYGMLTYFDVKNFAPMVTCPVYMAVGLQDPICPPRTNFAPYNLLRGEKRVAVYPECGHSARMADFAPKAYGWLIETFTAR